MNIIKNRIRNADNYLAGINDGHQFYVALTDTMAVNSITRAGFPIPLAQFCSAWKCSFRGYVVFERLFSS